MEVFTNQPFGIRRQPKKVTGPKTSSGLPCQCCQHSASNWLSNSWMPSWEVAGHQPEICIPDVLLPPPTPPPCHYFCTAEAGRLAQLPN